jgi:hypothetical protein
VRFQRTSILLRHSVNASAGNSSLSYRTFSLKALDEAALKTEAKVLSSSTLAGSM